MIDRQAKNWDRKIFLDHDRLEIELYLDGKYYNDR